MKKMQVLLLATTFILTLSQMTLASHAEQKSEGVNVAGDLLDSMDSAEGWTASADNGANVEISQTKVSTAALFPEGSKMIKVAMCQIFALDGDREGNFVRIENAISEAKEAGADIMCFPETVILGWLNTDAHNRAYPIPGKDSDRLCELARKYKTFLCVGIEEKDGANLYDSALLIDDNGAILLKHRKIHTLPELMTPPYAQGKNKDINAVDTKFGRIGVLICADTFIDEHLNRMAALKPDLLLVPYGWAAKEDAWPAHGKELEKVVKKAARICGAPAIGVDLIGEITKGPWTGLLYGGQSIAADKNGWIIAVAKDRDRDIKIVSITIL